MASKLLIAFLLGAISMTVVSAQNFDFFYFVQQVFWHLLIISCHPQPSNFTLQMISMHVKRKTEKECLIVLRSGVSFLFSTRENCGFREDMCAWAGMQWPGSYCDTDSGCCFPLTGSPGAQFGIHGLWPNYNDGGYPSKCGGDSFDPNVVHIANLMITLYRNSLLLSIDPVEIVVQKITSSQGPGYRGFSRTDKES
jgi:hypothetical protein